MPAAHRAHLEWSPSRIINWASTVGPKTRALAEAVLADRPHPEQGCRWVQEHQNVTITGATGTGKTFIVCALAQQACRKGYSAIYRRASRLFDELALARADGSYVSLLVKLARVDVLVIDDWGIARA